MAYPFQSAEAPSNHAPIATPEGDNEDSPAAPLAPTDTGLQRPRGNEPHPAQPVRPL